MGSNPNWRHFVIWKNPLDEDLVIEFSNNGIIDKSKKILENKKNKEKVDEIGNLTNLENKIKFAYFEQDSFWR